ncbi:MAG: hypothetical protein ABIF09_09685 [Gemmatimonadota bacterium]
MDKERSSLPAAASEAQTQTLPQVIELSRNQKLVIHRTHSLPPAPSGESEDCVRLLDSEGATSLTIRVGAGGTVIELGGGPVALNVEGDLAISSRRLMLHGREEVTITSDADVRIEAQENALIKAKRQEIIATRGDMKVYANDDVKIDGERIRMNC